MIARIWHGRTLASKADAYADYVRRTGIETQTSLEGNRGSYLLCRVAGEEAHFIVLSLWEDMKAIERFAGSDPETPVYYPEDDAFLLEREPVHHYEVLSQPTE